MTYRYETHVTYLQYGTEIHTTYDKQSTDDLISESIKDGGLVICIRYDTITNERTLYYEPVRW